MYILFYLLVNYSQSRYLKYLIVRKDKQNNIIKKIKNKKIWKLIINKIFNKTFKIIVHILKVKKWKLTLCCPFNYLKFHVIKAIYLVLITFTHCIQDKYSSKEYDEINFRDTRKNSIDALI